MNEHLEYLRRKLSDQGGRGVDLAEEIDELACEEGECEFSSEECGRPGHDKNNPEPG